MILRTTFKGLSIKIIKFINIYKFKLFLFPENFKSWLFHQGWLNVVKSRHVTSLCYMTSLQRNGQMNHECNSFYFLESPNLAKDAKTVDF